MSKVIQDDSLILAVEVHVDLTSVSTTRTGVGEITVFSLKKNPCHSKTTGVSVLLQTDY